LTVHPWIPLTSFHFGEILNQSCHYFHHPERLFEQLLGLAGSLMTFSKTHTLSDLPVHQHDAPGPAFAQLHAIIRPARHRHLGEVFRHCAHRSQAVLPSRPARLRQDRRENDVLPGRGDRHARAGTGRHRPAALQDRRAGRRRQVCALRHARRAPATRAASPGRRAGASQYLLLSRSRARARCSNYTRFTAEYANYRSDGSVDFVASPDKVCEFPYFIRSAVWYWIKNRTYVKADLGATHAAVNAITLIINVSGMDAAEKRRENFDELTYPAFK